MAARTPIDESFLDEADWSPNGRVLMFFRQTQGGQNVSGTTKLYSIDLSGQICGDCYPPRGL